MLNFFFLFFFVFLLGGGGLFVADSSSIHSDEDNYDDVKSTVANYHSARSQHYDQYRPAISPGAPSNPVSPGNFHILSDAIPIASELR